MKDKKRQQNRVAARTYFGLDLTKDYRDRYNVHRIDSESFHEGEKFALENHDKDIPVEFKDDQSFIEGYGHIKRILKAQLDSYNMGKEYYFKRIDIMLIPEIYKNNEFFMSGYNDAMDIELEEQKLLGKRR